jgi:hypothetical protein
MKTKITRKESKLPRVAAPSPFFRGTIRTQYLLKEIVVVGDGFFAHFAPVRVWMARMPVQPNKQIGGRGFTPARSYD